MQCFNTLQHSKSNEVDRGLQLSNEGDDDLAGVLFVSAARHIFQQAMLSASSLPPLSLLLTLPLMWMAFGYSLCMGTICLKWLVMPVLSVDQAVQLWSLDFARWWLVHRAIAMTNTIFVKHLRGTAILPAYMRALVNIS